MIIVLGGGARGGSMLDALMGLSMFTSLSLFSLLLQCVRPGGNVDFASVWRRGSYRCG